MKVRATYTELPETRIHFTDFCEVALLEQLKSPCRILLRKLWAVTHISMNEILSAWFYIRSDIGT